MGTLSRRATFSKTVCYACRAANDALVLPIELSPLIPAKSNPQLCQCQLMSSARAASEHADYVNCAELTMGVGYDKVSVFEWPM